ncbi:hypothetical protein D3C81_732620 [compost metagenome]
MMGYNRLDRSQDMPRFVRQHPAFPDQPCIKRLSFPQPRQMGLQHLAQAASLRSQLMQPGGRLCTKRLDHCIQERLLRGEMGKYRAVRHSRLPSYIRSTSG